MLRFRFYLLKIKFQKSKFFDPKKRKNSFQLTKIILKMKQETIPQKWISDLRSFPFISTVRGGSNRMCFT